MSENVGYMQGSQFSPFQGGSLTPSQIFLGGIFPPVH